VSIKTPVIPVIRTDKDTRTALDNIRNWLKDLEKEGGISTSSSVNAAVNKTAAPATPVGVPALTGLTAASVTGGVQLTWNTVNMDLSYLLYY
jgi:hypothetical protein